MHVELRTNPNFRGCLFPGKKPGEVTRVAVTLSGTAFLENWISINTLPFHPLNPPSLSLQPPFFLYIPFACSSFEVTLIYSSLIHIFYVYFLINCMYMIHPSSFLLISSTGLWLFVGNYMFESDEMVGFSIVPQKIFFIFWILFFRDYFRFFLKLFLIIFTSVKVLIVSFAILSFFKTIFCMFFCCYDLIRCI